MKHGNIGGRVLAVIVLLGASAGASAQTNVVKAWEFNPGDPMWGTYQVQGRITPEGYLTGDVAGDDPQISAPDLAMPSVYVGGCRTIRIRMRCSMTGQTARIYFRTLADPVGDEKKAKSFTLKPPEAGFQEYAVDMSDVAGWQGRLSEFRLDPMNGPAKPAGSFAVDYIRIEGNPPPPREVKAGEIVREWFAWIGGLPSISGWDLSNGKFEAGYFQFCKFIDPSAETAFTARRRFVPQTGGRFTWEFSFMQPRILEETTFRLLGGTATGIEIRTRGNRVLHMSAGREVECGTLASNRWATVRIRCDMATQKADVFFDGARAAEGVAFAAPVQRLDQVEIRISEKDAGELFVTPVLLDKGYAVKEWFFGVPEGKRLPHGWSSDGNVEVANHHCAWHQRDLCGLRLQAEGGKPGRAGMQFPALQERAVFTCKFMQPEKADGLQIEIGSRDKPAFALVSADGGLWAVGADGARQALRENYRSNVWYDVMLDVEPRTGRADVYLNTMKKAAGVTVAKGGLDFVRFASAKGLTWVDNVEVCPHLPDPPDYVPEPIPVKTANHVIVALQSCDLWREGTHNGWGRVHPNYANRRPLLGYYNGGDPEAEDWAIKWMMENGITFDFKCWYPDVGGPIHTPRHSEGLYGFRLGRYGNRFKYAVHFTNHGQPFPPPGFKEYLVPYLLEHLFCDPRYMKIDGKPVFGIYSLEGGNPKDAIAYLREEVRKAGYPGLVLLTMGSTPSRDVGVDAGYAYTYFGGGPREQEKQTPTGPNSAEWICTVSMGWDDRPWGGRGGSFLPPDQFKEILTWARDVYMPKCPPDSLGRRMMMLDNWNEYSEGHFIMPAAVHGFGYVNAVREVFGIGPFPSNVVPTDAQQIRLDTLFPKGDW